MELYSADKQFGELAEVAVARNPCPRSSFVAAVVHNDQACIQALERVLLNGFDNRMKEHETSIWGPQIAGRTEVVKVRGWSWVLVVGTANRRGKKKAMVILTS